MRYGKVQVVNAIAYQEEKNGKDQPLQSPTIPEFYHPMSKSEARIRDIFSVF